MTSRPTSDVARPEVSPKRRYPLRIWLDEASLIIVLGAAALALRLPYVDLVPAFTDEVNDNYRSFLASQGQLFPLTDTSTYIGSLWSWLAAASYLVSGNHPFAPRMLMVIIGTLTVLATYLLGRAWGGGRFAGAVAAGLLGTSLVHVVVNSHIAWSNCATPLFMTFAIWSLWVASGGAGDSEHEHAASHTLKLSRSHALVLSGLLWGLAFQTHPSVLAFMPGAFIFLLWRRGWDVLESRWLFLAAGLFVLVNLNLIAYNAVSGFDSVQFALRQADLYTHGESLGPELYAQRLGLLGLGLLQDLGGAVDVPDGDAEFLTSPGLLMIGAAVAAGLVQQWRRSNRLPVLVLASTVLILPLFNGKYNLLVNGRYLAPLLPILFASVGALFAAGLRRWQTPRRELAWPVPSWSAQVLLGLSAVLLVAVPLPVLSDYYARQVPISLRIYDPIFSTIKQLKVLRVAGEPVVIDLALYLKQLGHGNGHLDTVYRLMLELQGIPTRIANPDTGELLQPEGRCRDQLILLVYRPGEFHNLLVRRLGLKEVPNEPVRARIQDDGIPIGTGYRIYGLPRLPNAPRC
jgi:4-amino-4-deoxy-L-arabinose transferase-like glycosyltransferase